MGDETPSKTNPLLYMRVPIDTDTTAEYITFSSGYKASTDGFLQLLSQPGQINIEKVSDSFYSIKISYDSLQYYINGQYYDNGVSAGHQVNWPYIQRISLHSLV